MKPAPLITSDELHDVKRFMVLPLVLTVFERDKRLLATSGIKTPTPYTDLIDRSMDAATLEIRETRQRLRLAGIKVYDESRDNNGVSCKYVCRGYHGEFRILYNSLRSDVEIAMRVFLGEDAAKYARTDLPPHLIH